MNKKTILTGSILLCALTIKAFGWVPRSDNINDTVYPTRVDATVQVKINIILQVPICKFGIRNRLFISKSYRSLMP